MENAHKPFTKSIYTVVDEHYLKGRVVKVINWRRISSDLLGPILEKYHVTKQMFDTTIYEYSRYPEIFDQVYNDVLMKLNIMLDENDLEDTDREIVQENDQ